MRWNFKQRVHLKQIPGTNISWGEASVQAYKLQDLQILSWSSELTESDPNMDGLVEIKLGKLISILSMTIAQIKWQ